MRRWLLLLAALWLLPARAPGQELPLVAALSRTDIEVTTGFTGASLVVFGSTEQPIGPGGDEVIVVARGPTRPVVVRRKVSVAGLVWVNGPSARFPEVPGYYVLAGTRPAWQILPEEERQRNAIGLDALPLTSTGARNPGFRAALLELERRSGLWLEHTEAVEIEGSRLFYVRLPLPAAVPTGDYQVEVLLVRSRRIVARQELAFRVDRVGTADRIATVARGQPLVYGLACVLAAAFAGWLGSVLFRRG
ncbi:TIGR02186 family protein [Paracraurococcus lichenis]|uniref:TIGR02186 family protein n=1 Tax=Paracraurococcus lichenis TaxID=3064888 RepID=A0ABT9E6T4_9PROT|nr:TIGR02186 family protein [Paracraurococcus sp. LOR1-02]MDO9711833.1 TIGR02186 family protein [Paracraurococcus sp. LOR1-02]